MKERHLLEKSTFRTVRINRSSQKSVAFESVEDFVDRLRCQDARIVAAESRSLKNFSARANKAKAARSRIVALWIPARLVLSEAVREIDAAIKPLNLVLSLADDVSHDDLVGAVEVRLHRLDGGMPRSLLDIEIDLNGRHRTAVFDTRFPVQVVLPPIDLVRLEDYRAALMAFVHDVMRTTEPRIAQRCAHCGQPALSFAAAHRETVSGEEHDLV